MSLPIVSDRDRNENLVRTHETISWLEMLAASVNVFVISFEIGWGLWADSLMLDHFMRSIHNFADH
jgi:hypothetical protein